MFIFVNLALLVVFGPYSCNSDDNSSPPNEKNTLIGKWKLISVTDEGQLEEPSECVSKSIVEFKKATLLKILLS